MSWPPEESPLFRFTFYPPSTPPPFSNSVGALALVLQRKQPRGKLLGGIAMLRREEGEGGRKA